MNAQYYCTILLFGCSSDKWDERCAWIAMCCSVQSACCAFWMVSVVRYVLVRVGMCGVFKV
jgi:hypothetical protein